MGTRPRGALLLAIALLGAACASPPLEEGRAPVAATPETFWGRRGRDLRQSFELALWLGPGLGARVTATRAVQVGWLMVGPADHESRIVPPPQLVVGLRDGAVGTWSIRTAEYGLSPWYSSDAVVTPVAPGGEPWRGDLADGRGSALQAQLHLGLVGLSAGFDPRSFGWLLLGLVGIERSEVDQNDAERREAPADQ